MYLDSAYIAKYYVNEPASLAVRKLIREAAHVCSSGWALIEVTAVFRRHVREGALTVKQGHELIDLFRTHAQDGLWNLLPVTEALLRRTASLIRALPPDVPIRAGDAIHLASALETDEAAIWTNNRHLLSAATYVGLVGKTVTKRALT